MLAVLISCKTDKEETLLDLTKYVDPQIGSVHGRWFFYTPGAVPFGMVKLAPHTNAYGSQGGWGPVGYDDRQKSIEGFGLFHEFQVGGVVFMPTTGEVKTVPGTLKDPDAGYRSRFDKDSENAEAGYYTVLLKDYMVKAELTATTRVGYMRFTFPETSSAHLIIDVGHKQGESSDVIDAYAGLVNGNEIEGYVITYPEYVKFCDPGKRVRMYFVARLSKAPISSGSFVDKEQKPDLTSTKGVNNGLYLTFDMHEGEALEVQAGVSYTSIENARVNLDAESEGRSFDQVRADAKRMWNERLNKIIVEGGKEKDRVKFYTGLYHALLGRGISSDVNGHYPLVDGGIGQIPLDETGTPKHHHFNTDGMWGGFWNLSQVWALAYPGYFKEYVQSNIDFYSHRGWLHDGEATGTYTNGVQTNFQGLILASAYNCGIRDFDVKNGYKAAVRNELDYIGRNLGNGKYDLSYFVKNGYVPYKDTTISNGWVFNFGASHTLEYAFSSYAVAQMAKELGDTTTYGELMKQAGYYKNIFDPETKFIRPKLENGKFIKDFDPMRGWDGFQEGNAYQFTWYVPHDVAGLIALIGKDEFNKRLEYTFSKSQKSLFGGGSEEISSFSGVDKLYNQGNQPCLHQSWLFNYSGKPWLTQKWTREICNVFYGTEPLHGYGYGQDEDQGQLGAWFVLNSMGLFDVQGLSSSNPTMQLGSPMFDKVTIKLDPKYYKGKELVIETSGNASENRYVQSVTFNGKAVNNCWLYWKDLVSGGTLKFKMGSKPNNKWGTGTPPPSMSNESALK